MTAPLLTPAQAAVLLDDVILGRVVDCIDFSRLYGVQRKLARTMHELEGIDIDAAVDLAVPMVRHALRRIADDHEAFADPKPVLDCLVAEAEFRREERLAAEAGSSP